ncbi:hypothetical protein ACNQ1U_00155 [Mycoplasma sp. 653B]|uniref:hypothetical protein n=1 Tax=Mycoplasma sp. 653B TaxID=3401677 RepID=UPI003AAB724B
MNFSSNLTSPLSWFALILCCIFLIKDYYFYAFWGIDFIHCVGCSFQAKYTESKLNLPTKCNIKKYNKGHKLVNTLIKRKLKQEIIYDSIFRIVYAIIQSIAFAFAILNNYITYFNVFCWMGFALYFGFISRILQIKNIMKMPILSQTLIEDKNDIENFSNKIPNKTLNKNSTKLTCKIFVPLLETYSSNSRYISKINFKIKYWKRLGANNSEIEDIFYFLFSFSYKLDNFFLSQNNSLLEIQNFYHNLQALSSNNGIK